MTIKQVGGAFGGGGGLDGSLQVRAVAAGQGAHLVPVLGVHAVLAHGAVDVAAAVGDVEHVGALGLAGVAHDAAFFDPDFGDGHDGLLEMHGGPWVGRIL